jgi:hypothetical protein
MGHLAAGEYEEARVALQAAVELIDSDAPGARQFLPMMDGVLAQVLTRLGDCARAVELAERGIDVARRKHIPGFASYSWYGLSLARIGQGRPDEAQDAVEGLARAIEATDMRVLAPCVPECRAGIARLRGDDAGVTRYLAEALAAYRAMGAHGHARRVEALLRD